MPLVLHEHFLVRIRPAISLRENHTMKRITLITLLLLCAKPIVSAQNWPRANLEKSPRHREWVTVKHHGRSVETCVVYPESEGKTPAVLVINEIFAMTHCVQHLADQTAASASIAS